jgi:hypothetical protein
VADDETTFFKLRWGAKTPQFQSFSIGYWQRWMPRHLELPKGLFHYTDGGGAKGIVETKRLWATSIRHLNDAKEVEYACSLLEEVLDEVRKCDWPESAKWFLETAGAEEVRNPYRNMLKAYVVCFCAREDLLSQWRAYGDRGSGYCIGFDAGALARHPRSATDLILRRVEYDKDTQVALIRSAVEGIASILSAPNVPGGIESTDLYSDALAIFMDILIEALVCFKHKGFSEEGEWRIIYLFEVGPNEPFVRIRPGRNFLIPYVELDLASPVPPWTGRLPIVSVRQGPTAHTELAEESLRLLLDQSGYREAQVLRSDIPYRG